MTLDDGQRPSRPTLRRCGYRSTNCPPPNTHQRLHERKDVSVRLAANDFGTGFSSLSYLRSFPFEVIKTDNMFTAELPHSARAQQLVEAIQQLASSVPLEAIAEGVEREEQPQALTSGDAPATPTAINA